jgi:hypothetical protein
MSQEVKQVKETLQIPCIHNKTGTGATATVNSVQLLLFAVKTEKGTIVYYYAPACKNYKLNEETGKYKCETSLGSGASSCQLKDVLNAALEREGVLYIP